MVVKSSISALCLLSMSTLCLSNPIDFSGFGTVGGGIFQGDDIVYRGVENSFESDAYTLFALQASAELHANVQATGQFVVRGIDDYDLEAEWAFLSVDIGPRSLFRLGRLRTPFYNYSDALEVGFAYHWVSPPVTSYGSAVINAIEGVDFIYRHPIAYGWTGNLQTFYGNIDEKIILAPSKDVKTGLNVKDVYGLVYTVSNNWLNFRVSHSIANKISVGTPEALTRFGAQADFLGIGALYRQLTPENIKTKFSSAGFTIDTTDWFLGGEYILGPRPDAENIFFGDTQSWYLTTGYRFNNVTAHVSYVKETADIDTLKQFASAAFLTTEALRATTDNIMDESSVENIIVGLRYDLNRNIAIKFEVDHVELKEPVRKGNLYSFSVDVIF